MKSSQQTTVIIIISALLGILIAGVAIYFVTSTEDNTSQEVRSNESTNTSISVEAPEDNTIEMATEEPVAQPQPQENNQNEADDEWIRTDEEIDPNQAAG